MSDILAIKNKNVLIGQDAIVNMNLCSGVELVLLKEHKIVDIATNGIDSMFVFQDGKLITCRSDSYQKFNPVLGMLEIITQVKSGMDHNIVLTKQGVLLQWSLVTGDVIPRPVNFRCQTTIKQIACGFHHNIALDSAGTVYTWGSNRRRAVEDHEGSFHDEPEILHSLTGLVVSCVAAGASHSFVLTTSGALLGWGVNEFGQLGVGDMVNRSNPELCILPKGENIKYVACGDCHSAILCENGNVYTFGDGRDGQLGYSSNCETKPKQVTLAEPIEVSMVACGSTHTTIYDKINDTIYVFGRGSKSGYESESFIPIKSTTLGQGSIVRSLHAGWDQTFVTFSSDDEEYPQRDNRKIIEDQQIDVITSESITNCTSITNDIKEKIKKIFRSLSSINGSFYKNSYERSCNADDHGVDIDACKKLFELISEYKPKPGVPKNLLSGLVHVKCNLKPLAIESLRFLVMLPFMPMVHAKNFLRNIIELDDNHWKVLEKWWQISGNDYVIRFVQLLKTMLPKIIKNKYDKLGIQRKNFAPLDVMKKIRDSSVISGLSDELWYLEHIEKLCNLEFECYCWRFLENYEGVRLCDYSFIFDVKAKSILLEKHSAIEMRIALNPNFENDLDGLYESLRQPLDSISDEHFRLEISRENIFMDMINGLRNREAEYKKPLKVQFNNEQGADYGGPGREFFRLLMEELPNHNVFKSTDSETSEFIWFSSEANHLHCEMVGVAFGLAVYNGYNISDIFPLRLYKVLLKRPPIFEDLKEMLPIYGRAIEELMKKDTEEECEDLCFFFEFDNANLVPDGKNKTVNKENRLEYKKRMVNYVLQESVEHQLKAFQTGFLKVCGGRMMELLQPEELRAILIGKEIHDWGEIAETSICADLCTGHPAITMLWAVFEELTVTQKKKFLIFCTGSDRIPFHGMEEKPIKVHIVQKSEDHLPSAWTCYNFLYLPPYQSKETLKHKLLLAIESPNDFGFM